MILPGNFMWKQLNGPQTSAISAALLEYGKAIFDNTLDYINTLSVDTANDSHLTLLGIIAGFVRPVIRVPDTSYFYFTEEEEHDVDTGFSTVSNLSSGGHLTSIYAEKQTKAQYLNTEYYRTLLKAVIQGEGEIGGLTLLDDICYALAKYDRPNASIEGKYTFEFMQGTDITPGRAAGDVKLDLGNLSDWKEATVIYAILVGLANTIYAPVPQVFVNISSEEDNE